jgi:glycosyltransferase involved in cell wall biosynthesis
LLHVGDNHHSDVAMAQASGIQSIHVDQGPLLELERPEYGHRADIHEEMADLVKLFLFQILFNARSNDADHLYFLGRDGCVMSRVLNEWDLPIVRDYLLTAPVEDLFLNRATACWGAINFSGEWLEQAVGFAFWLNQGRASAREVLELLGVGGDLQSFNERIFDGNSDTRAIVDAIRREGLAPAVKASILAKRESLSRYLEDIGFYDKKNVHISDVGYSGTVVRDLNLFFLQEGIRPSRGAPPHMTLHLLATNNNFGHNRVVSLPHATFCEQVILPSHRLPGSLIDSFAWLEVFFKHPTLAPVLRFVEKDGRVQPDFKYLPQRRVELPSETVARFAQAKDADIVLLWMASQQFWQMLVDPLVERFLAPDERTIAQLRGDLFETDAVRGRMRSVVYVDSLASDDEIYQICRSRDYWIPGSLAASAQVRRKLAVASADLLEEETAEPLEEDAPPEDVVAEAFPAETGPSFKFPAIPETPQPEPKPSGLRRFPFLLFGKRKQMQRQWTRDEFDPAFYRSYYPDLHGFPNDRELWKHYCLHGRREGRLPTEAALLARLEALHGPLPGDFDPENYLALHADVAAACATRLRAMEHYQKHGRYEGRPYRFDFSELDLEFERLALTGAVTLTEEERALRPAHSIRDIVFKRHDIFASRWLHYVAPVEFRALNAHWCGPIESLADCVLALLERGLPHCPSLSLGARFDLDFYRRTNPEVARATDENVYRHWLNRGANDNRAPSEEFALARLIGRREFPDAFDWKAFSRRHGANDGSKPDRLEALRNFLNFFDRDANGAESFAFIRNPGAPALLRTLAHRAWSGGDREKAIRAFEEALRQGGATGRIQHFIGDLHRESGRNTEALAAYRKGVAAERPDRWSFINGADIALQENQLAAALQFVNDGNVAWKHMKAWRRRRDAAYSRALDERFSSLAAQAKKAPSSILEPTREVAAQAAARVARELPITFDFHDSEGPALVLTGRDISHRVRGFETDSRIRIFSQWRNETRLCYEALLGARVLVWHESWLNEESQRLLLTAKALGIPTVFWWGELSDVSDLKFSSLTFDDAPRAFTRLRAQPGLTDWLAGLFCDRVVTTIAGFVPMLEQSLAGRRVEALTTRPTSSPPRSQGETKLVLARAANGCLPADKKKALDALCRVLDAHSGVRLLLDRNFGKSAATAALVDRIVPIDLDEDFSRAAELVELVDVVVEVARPTSDGFELWAEAAAKGAPFVLVRGKPSPQEGMDAADEEAGAESHSAVEEIGLRLSELLENPDPSRFQREAESFSDAHAAASTREPVFDANASEHPKKRAKILFVNVFFPPQTVGGATRVLKDNIDYFLDNCADKYDFAVFTTDDENEQRGEFSVDAYRGAPVFRIAPPQELDMDWRCHNPEIGARFRQLLRSFKPDLVHIHCLQRLSVAVAEECKAAGVPYVVTLHDAWWLSDYPFLTDPQGFTRMPQERLVAQPYLERLGPAASLSRGARLREALAAARERFAVSRSFADLYRSCGFDSRLVENGLSKIEREPRSRAKGGRVRLCHIGGREAHKGAYLVEVALRQNEFRNLHFTVIDLGRDTGDQTLTVWGNTPVTITGKIPSLAIGAFYAEMDVLLAPSTWPESYGLVTREALAHGLWVIASDCGAIGEDVVPGANGLIVEVADASGIVEALRQIDADPDKYRQSPSAPIALRSADEQAAALVTIYDELLSSESTPAATQS